MSTDHEFFLMQLGDSFFPSGMFGLSQGLESMVKHNKVRNERDVLGFITRQMDFQLVPCDCMVFLAAMEFAKKMDVEGLVEADGRFYSMRLIRETRNSSVRSGSQVLNCAIQMASEKNGMGIAKQFQKKIGSGGTPGTYPVCLGVAAVLFGIPQQSGVRMMLYSFSQSIVAAAIRLGILEHVGGQRMLVSLSDKINEISKNAVVKPLDDLWQLTPVTDIMQMIHESDGSRMFMT